MLLQLPMVGSVKTISITIDEHLDTAARLEAQRLGISKSALIRQGLLHMLQCSEPPAKGDPWTTLAGFGPSGLSVEPGEVDDIVYRTGACSDGCGNVRA